jgi:hypothetical protein
MQPKLWSESLKDRDLGIHRVGDGVILKCIVEKEMCRNSAVCIVIRLGDGLSEFELRQGMVLFTTVPGRPTQPHVQCLPGTLSPE